MAQGEWELAVSTVAFLAVKFAGYWAAAVFLNQRYRPIAPAMPPIFALCRMLIGFGVSGGTYYLLAFNDIAGLAPAYLLLAPTRLLEWLFVLWLFYERRDQAVKVSRLAKYAVAGTIWSYVLDLPAFIFSTSIPGGFTSFC